MYSLQRGHICKFQTFFIFRIRFSWESAVHAGRAAPSCRLSSSGQPVPAGGKLVMFPATKIIDSGGKFMYPEHTKGSFPKTERMDFP